MYTITFYSFKGGVGRTFALVNVAAQLAKMGRKVLLVDADLEAPGLETFDRLRPAPFAPPKRDRRVFGDGEHKFKLVIEQTEKYDPPTHQGLVEYVTEYMRTRSAPDVRQYIYSPGPVGKKGGEISVMCAGRRDAEYQSALTKIDWLTLYREHDGFLLFEDMKAQWESELRPDYVLIDSRTGHTDVEGICTRQLPDAVVVLFFPNEQNLLGLQEVCRRIRAEQTSGLMKYIRLHFVMSNVPDLDDQDRSLRRRLQLFDRELNIDASPIVIHRYESAMLFNQAIFVLDRPKSRLAQEYRRLTLNLMVHNEMDRDAALFFLRAYWRYFRKQPAPSQEVACIMRARDKTDLDYGRPGAGESLERIAGNFPNDAEIAEQIAQCREAKRRWIERCKQITPTAAQQDG